MKHSVTVTDHFLLPLSSKVHPFYFLPLAVHNWHFLYVLYIGVSCGQLDDPRNGHVDTSAGTSSGDVARYSCDTGYTASGTAERTCQADGRWNGSVPICESEILGCHAWSSILILHILCHLYNVHCLCMYLYTYSIMPPHSASCKAHQYVCSH